MRKTTKRTSSRTCRRAPRKRPGPVSGAFLVAAAGLLAPITPCEAQDLAGTWDVEWAQAVRYEDGELQIQRWGDAALELHLEGDQLTGSWTTNIQERVQWTVTGTFANGRLTLTAAEHDSDNAQLDMVEEMRWRGTLTDAGLEGDMTMVFRGRTGDLRWRPWSATKAGAD